MMVIELQFHNLGNFKFSVADNRLRGEASEWKAGMKLEAKDRANPTLIACTSTISEYLLLIQIPGAMWYREQQI